MNDHGTATTVVDTVNTDVNNARKSWQDAGLHKSETEGYVSLINVLVLKETNDLGSGGNTSDPEGCVDTYSIQFQIDAGEHFGDATSSFTAITGLRNSINNNAILAL